MNPIPVVPPTQDYPRVAGAERSDAPASADNRSFEDSTPPSPPGVEPDDPRVLAALEEYLTAVEAGRPVDHLEFLQRHGAIAPDRKSTRLNSSHIQKSRMPSSA